MKLAFIAALAALLCACAASPEPIGIEHCVQPTHRNAGMGVVLESCTAWAFGPSRVQRERFNRAHGLPLEAK